MNFTQWKAHAAKKAVAKVTYCCGVESTLVELVIDDIRTILDVPVTDYVEMGPEDNFWETASLYPLDYKVNRLTVVRNSDKITDWSKLQNWVAESRYNASNYLLFISDEADGESEYEKGKKKGYVEHIELIRTKGKFIKCSTPNQDDLLAWCANFGLTKACSEHLIYRCSANVELLYEVLKKVHVWPGSPSTKALDLLVQQQPSESFVDALVLGKKSQALAALQNLGSEEKTKLVARLDARLDMVMEIGKYVRKRVWAGEIAAQTGINVFLVKKFFDVSKTYDFNKVKYCRNVLAIIDGAFRDGAKIGVWESLVGLW